MNYNLVSVILGVLAIVIPFIGLKLFKKSSLGKQVIFFTVSFTLCNLSVVMQILEFKRKTEIGDYAAILDTAGATATVSIVLMIIIAVANLYCMAAKFIGKKDDKQEALK